MELYLDVVESPLRDRKARMMSSASFRDNSRSRSRGFLNSSSTRALHDTLSRPVPASSPLSATSPFLEEDDPLSASLLSRKDAQAERKAEGKRRQQSSQRVQRRRELGRRMAERETLENFVQTPFAKSKGRNMQFGFNVIDGRIAALRDQYSRAEKFGAVSALEVLEKFIRQNCLKVKDLFDFVDHDRSGAVDRSELREVFKFLRLDLNDQQFESLFRYLDKGGNGSIDAMELEDAVREHRRFRWLRGMIETHERDQAEAERTRGNPALSSSSSSTAAGPAAAGVTTSPSLVSSSVSMDPDDPRRSFASLLPPRGSTAPGGGSPSGSGGIGGLRVCSLPLVGQKLMSMQLRSPSAADSSFGGDWPMGGGGGGSVDSVQQHPQHQPQSSTNRVPRTVWELQAEKAMQTTLSANSRHEAGLFLERDARRKQMLVAMAGRREARQALEDKARRG